MENFVIPKTITQMRAEVATWAQDVVDLVNSGGDAQKIVRFAAQVVTCAAALLPEQANEAAVEKPNE